MMVDPKKRLDDLVNQIKDGSGDVALVTLHVGVQAILGDFATELADLVAGRLVINGCKAETARDVVKLIQGHAERFNVG
jgi:hypothetical protein